MIALIIYLLCGLALSFGLLPALRYTVKGWLGLVFGCVLAMWLPCLAAFFLGFTMAAQLAAVGIAAAVTAAVAVTRAVWRRPALRAPRPAEPCRNDLVGLAASVLATVLCAYLLHTHVLRPEADGSLWVGQSTYGDLAMHLGFIESLYRQGTFPPEYSILPGTPLNYPFLVDAASAGLRFFGLSLRMSVIVPSVVMLFCVFFGFWLLADLIAERLAPVLMAWLLFVSNGGFGFVLFPGRYSFAELLDGFYITPTNLVDEDLRWVNVICDMLIPQRTTMAGWCVVLAAIYLLVLGLRKTVAGEGGRRELLVLGPLAGSLLMIHTHSFLALGILSAAWFFLLLPAARRAGQARALVVNYVLYGVIAIGLAAPQFFRWTAGSVETGNLLQWNLFWVAGENGAIRNPLLFYVVNIGVVFIGMWPAFFLLRGEKRALLGGAAAIFVVANVVAFQPNLYDNNKLLYIWFMLTDILVCDMLWDIIAAAPRRAVRAAVAGVIVVLGTLSGAMSIAREFVSNYRLFAPEQTAAAAFAVGNTAPDSVFLTATNHTNTISVLTGRSIVCGPGLYLHFHGVDYAAREAALPALYAGGDDFPALAAAYDIDYVYISEYETANYDVNFGYFADNYPLVYDEGGICIYSITSDSREVNP